MKAATIAKPENVIKLPQRKRLAAVIDGRFKVVPFTNRSGNQSWRVMGTKRDGTRIRENFAAEAAARCRHIELETEYLRGHAETVIRATKLSAEQIQIFELAAMKLGDDWQHILEAVDCWKRHGKQTAAIESPRVDDAVSKFVEWLDAKDCPLRESTRRKYRYRVGTVFRNSVPNHRIAAFTADSIEALIAKQGKAPSDKDTLKRAVSAFFSWCIERPRRWAVINPCREVKITIPKNDSPPSILTVAECESLLRSAMIHRDGMLAPYVALCLFGGLRPESEAKRLRPEQINLADGEIRIEASQSKTGRSRVITINATLAAWLRRYRDKPLHPANWRKEFDAIKLAAGFGTPTDENPNLKPWPVDVMRHTAISHFFRQSGSYGLSAEQFDNSEAIIKKHYQGRVNSEDTKRFYAMTPVAIEKGAK